MSIDELIDELIRRRQMHGGETVVRTTWEGVARDIDLDNIYYVAGAQSREWHKATLWIDADFNQDKPKSALAAEAIEKIMDPSAPPEERAQRRRRLTKGPPEFREDRVDQPKSKR
jgi:hypothetical protein